MATKNKSKKTDTTTVRVKKTKTGAKRNDSRASLRWYHILSTIVVISLAIIAIIKIFSRFDISLYGSDYTVKYAKLACSISPKNEDIEYHYSGVKNGDYIGQNGVTKEDNSSSVQIISLDESKVSVRIREDLSSDSWHTEKIRYGEEKTVTLEDSPDCVPALVFSLSK